MNNVDVVSAKSSSAIMLKGSMLTLTTIQLINPDLTDLGHQLDEKIKQAPNFFQHAPIVIDIGRLSTATPIDFQTLVYTLRSKKLIPIGIRGGNQQAKEAAIAVGLAIFPEDKAKGSTQVATPKTDLKAEKTAFSPACESFTGTTTRLVTQPVRSGQQIYAPGGDLIILAAVSHGAEVLADGHIHVHGPLRGRALAGVTGNKEAMIFCKSLEAELVSIAGQYQISEDLKVKENVWKQTVCIQLQEARLNIHAV